MNVSATRVSLIEKLCDHQDNVAWTEFANLYGPVIYAYGLKRGLQSADATDLTQDVLQIVMDSVTKFQYRQPGSFRGWLFTITLNRIRRRHVLAQRQIAGSGRTTVAQALGNHAKEEQDWDQQLQMHLFHWAAEQIRSEFQENSWQAFWQTSVEQQPAAKVAEQLKMSVGSVYVAKSRIIKRIREKVAYAQDGGGTDQ